MGAADSLYLQNKSGKLNGLWIALYNQQARNSAHWFCLPRRVL